MTSRLKKDIFGVWNNVMSVYLPISLNIIIMFIHSFIHISFIMSREMSHHLVILRLSPRRHVSPGHIEPAWLIMELGIILGAEPEVRRRMYKIKQLYKSKYIKCFNLNKHALSSTQKPAKPVLKMLINDILKCWWTSQKSPGHIRYIWILEYTKINTFSNLTTYIFLKRKIEKESLPATAYQAICDSNHLSLSKSPKHQE